MIVYNPMLSSTDMDDYANEASSFDAGLKIIDTALAGFKEGIAANPTNSILQYAYSQKGEQNLSGKDANEKYGLTGTDVAFDDNEMITENHARIAADRYINRSLNESIATQVSEDYGMIGTFTNFAGSIGAGIIDPINILSGVGTTAAAARFGMLSPKKAFVDVIARKNIGDVAAANIAENFAVTALIETTATPLGEIAYNQEISQEQRMATILGGTFLGGAMGTAADAATLRAVRRTTLDSLYGYGSKATELNEQALAKHTLDVANGIKPNPDHVIKVAEYDYYSTRPHQEEYYFKELGNDKTAIGLTESNAIKDQDWVIAKRFDSTEFDQVEIHGNGTITLVDDYNLAHNRVSSFKDTDVVGEVYTLKINKERNILDSDMFLQNRKIIAEDSKKILKSFVELSREQSRKIDNSFDMIVRDSNNIVEFKLMMQEEFGDIKNLPSVDDLVNKVLSAKGYDGYHFVGNAKTLNKRYNGITLFKAEDFKGAKKNSLYIGKGKGSELTSLERAKLAPKMDISPDEMRPIGAAKEELLSLKGFKDLQEKGVMTHGGKGNRLFFNKDMFESVFDPDRTVPLDRNDPRAASYARPMQDMEAAEIRRRNDPTQKIGYDEKAMNSLDRAKNPEAEFDPTKDFLDREGITVDQLENLKNLDASTKAALQKIKESNYVHDAYMDYVRCRGFNV